VVIRALIISFALPVLAATNGRQASVVRALFIKGTRLALNSDLTLTSLQRTFGPTALVAPRHHDDPWSECYSALDSIGPFTIRLQSDELGGPEHVLLGFELNRDRASDLEARTCASVGVVYDAKTDNGLYLGMPVAVLLKVMGRPARTTEGNYSFEFREVHERVTDSSGKIAEAYENWGSVEVKTVHGRVHRLFAWYVGK